LRFCISDLVRMKDEPARTGTARLLKLTIRVLFDALSHSVLSPGFDSSIGRPLQPGQTFCKIPRHQCLDIGFYQFAQFASLNRGEIADRNCISITRLNGASISFYGQLRTE
jgi:hypothetical protein